MKWHKALAAASGLAILTATTGTAQVTTQELFHVKFRATCKPGNDANGRQTRMRDRDLIELCVGNGFSQRDLRRNFALVYSPATDSIQVADTRTGAVLCDVFQFSGGTIVTNNNRLERFTFVFIPSDETAVGSAVITERTTGLNQGTVRARISGRLQFTVPDGVNWITNHSIDSLTGVADASATFLSANVNGMQDANAFATNGVGADFGDTNNGTGGSDINGSNSGRDVGRNGNDAQGDSIATGGSENLGPFVQAAAAAETVTLENAQICTGTFTVGRAFEPGVPGQGGNDDDDTLDGVSRSNSNGGNQPAGEADANGGVIDQTPANGGASGDNVNDLNGDNGNRNGNRGNTNNNNGTGDSDGTGEPPLPPAL